MKQKKKILALALTCAMLVSCVSTGFAADVSTGNGQQDPPIVIGPALSGNFGLVEGTPAEKPSKTANLKDLVDLNGIKYADAGVKGPNTSLPERNDDKFNVYVDITKDGYQAEDEVSFDVYYSGLPSEAQIEGMEFKVDLSALKDVQITSDLLEEGTGYNISGTTLNIVYNGVVSPLTDASMKLFTVTGKLAAELTDYENIEASGIFVEANSGDINYDQEDGTAVAFADSLGTTIPVPAETKTLEDLTFKFVDATNNTLEYGTDYTIKLNNKELSYDEALAELAKLNTNADLNAFLNSASVVFKTEGKFDVTVQYTGEAAVTEGMEETVKPQPATDPNLDNLKSSYSISVSKSKNTNVKLAEFFGSNQSSDSKNMYKALESLNTDTAVADVKVTTGTGLDDISIGNNDDVSSSRIADLLEECTTVGELLDAIDDVSFKLGSSSSKSFTFKATIGGKAVELKVSYKNTSGNSSSSDGTTGITGNNDDNGSTILIPNFSTGGILTKANSSALSGKTITPMLATSDKFAVNVPGVTSLTGFDPLIAKVPYTLGAKNAADIVVVDKNNNVVLRSAYLDSGYVGAALSGLGLSNGYTITTMRQSFDDTNIDWANDAISALAVRGIIKGVDGSNNNFEPDRAITRAEFIKLVIAMFDVADPSARAQFTDVADTDWYSSVIGTAQNLGIVTGYEDGSFNPNATITRQEMCTMLSRAASVLGVSLKNVNAMTTYDDDWEIGDWAKDSVYSMQMANVMKGVGYNQFQPTANTTRAQAAVAVYNMLKASLDF